MASYKRYSVYLRKDDTPVIIFASAEECASVLGCAIVTFYSYLSKQRKGIPYPKKYCIYEDEVSEEDRKLFYKERKPKLDEADIRIIGLMLKGLKQIEIAERLGYHVGCIHYRCKKILRATGLDPRRFPELIKLRDLYFVTSSDC